MRVKYLALSLLMTLVACGQTAQPTTGSVQVPSAVTSGSDTSPKATSSTSSNVSLAAKPPSPTAPTISSLTPNTGPAAGGTSVTLTGTNFTTASKVMFGKTAAKGVTYTSPTQLTVTSPAGSGTVNVTVTTTSGTSSGVPFTYQSSTPAPGASLTGLTPNTGPQAGGTNVTINGTNLKGTSEVRFGTALGLRLKVVSDT